MAEFLSGRTLGNEIWYDVDSDFDIEIDGYWNRKVPEYTLRVWDISKKNVSRLRIIKTIQNIETLEQLKMFLNRLVKLLRNRDFERLDKWFMGKNHIYLRNVVDELYFGEIVELFANGGVIKVHGKRNMQSFSSDKCPLFDELKVGQIVSFVFNYTPQGRILFGSIHAIIPEKHRYKIGE
ncbi:hypothetical protein I4Q36_02070 [Tuanshanicoccus lijuaniae]|uniref:hypothetical protein n=1 Tax=Aerococcaceae bacterium zg-1292 TaxID=2774330 RepID=UPI001935A6CD|nr:hypothetical protein [Aerococcaceae bacterium zg-A91]QQA37526.1 hypothetical protein I4Q36_02070 [Aerococcaceae bacterium zg-1292]